MHLQRKYYVAKKTEDGLIKVLHVEDGPYYDRKVLISQDGYDSQAAAIEAVCRLRYDFSFLILEEFTVVFDD